MKEIESLEDESRNSYDLGYDAGYDEGYADGFEESEAETADELDFYRNNAVIVTVSGEKFHCWGCYHLEGRRYYIYNVELAEDMGYEPCADCWWSWVDWQ